MLADGLLVGGPHESTVRSVESCGGPRAIVPMKNPGRLTFAMKMTQQDEFEAAVEELHAELMRRPILDSSICSRIGWRRSSV